MIIDAHNPPKLNLALRRFVSRYPLFGVLLSRFRVVMGRTPTMAVGFDGGPGGARFILYVSPDFLESISLAEAEGVIHHEVCHVLYGHLIMTDDEYPDASALMVAQETTVNERIPEPLPGQPIIVEDYPQLPPDEDTATRYARLASPQAGAASGAGTGNPEPIDDHEHWAEVRDHGALARVVLEGAIGEMAGLVDSHPPTDEESSALNATSSSWGMISDKMEALLAGQSIGRVAWQDLLRRFIGQELRPLESFAVPPRRFPGLLGIVPGIRRSARDARIQAVIDTSASMAEENLDAIAAELDRVGQMFEVVVVECDAEIQAVYTYRGHIAKVHGRGGTDFRPALEPAFLRHTRADLVLYFTDGGGPCPDNPPQVPVLWILTDDRFAMPDWTKCIAMA